MSKMAMSYISGLTSNMFDLDKYYIIGVSGGPDSMALLDMMRIKQLKLVVIHINYHHRDTALRDQLIVERYCQKYQIKLFVFDYQNTDKGNFQDNARVYRYQKFKEICDLYDTKEILIAHQLDDLVETYYLQKYRGSIPRIYGLTYKIDFGSYYIYRPLLKYTKEELINYLENKNIEYGIDESNLSDDYIRNQIRHQKIDFMTKEEKLAIYSQLEKINQENENKRNHYLKYIHNNEINYVDYLNIEDKEYLLRLLFNFQPSLKQIKDIIKQLNKDNLIYKIKDQYLIKEYGKIYLIDMPKDYQYQFDNVKTFTCPYFKIVTSGDKFHSATVTKDDFPITIRNFREHDEIKMRYGTKKINRFFIDNKIPHKERYYWPIVLNSKGEIILVVGIGCSLNYYSNNPNLFVIK